MLSSSMVKHTIDSYVGVFLRQPTEGYLEVVELWVGGLSDLELHGKSKDTRHTDLDRLES